MASKPAYSIAALRGWALVASRRWYDGACRVPTESPDRDRIWEAAVAGLVKIGPCGVSAQLTPAGERLLRLYQDRSNARMKVGQ